MLKKFKDLSEKEILAIAISAEDEDGRIYGEFADALREEYPSTAYMFEDMRKEEVVHRDRLISMFRQRFGEHIPLIRRENVKGFLQRKPVWLVRPLGVKVARKQAEVMELEAQRFYHKAASRTSDASTRELLYQLAEEERKHTQTAGELEERHLTPGDPTGPGGADGRVGLDAGTAVCGSVRDEAQLGRVSGGAGSFDWRGDFDGVFRRAL